MQPSKSQGACARPVGTEVSEDCDGASVVSRLRIWNSGGNLWHLSGQADLSTEPVLRAAMRSVSAAGGGLVLDCGELSFIDVASLRAIARTACGLGTPVTVNGANETLRRAWSLLDLHAAAPNVEFST
ncbi:STAS domain-containing protein [Actinocrinis puniceicyclus]|uniref:STAS domain-containing protein n=1 Tax=Actinocrinis puniceicyclus TaxID=977794 RepID=A0A8J8BAI5_9ACTN|nr:STAS domain-containing protein [Actinocrinis puniceicyclus]MBS2961435.1 STAS domain-containing protein [Actinocrinis puniceicyclus]